MRGLTQTACGPLLVSPDGYPISLRLPCHAAAPSLPTPVHPRISEWSYHPRSPLGSDAFTISSSLSLSCHIWSVAHTDLHSSPPWSMLWQEPVLGTHIPASTYPATVPKLVLSSYGPVPSVQILQPFQQHQPPSPFGLTRLLAQEATLAQGFGKAPLH